MIEARRALKICMESLSEDLWAAAGLTGLEFELWSWVEARKSGSAVEQETETPEWMLDADTLAWLAEQAGGWWRWSEDLGEPFFIALDEWLEIYASRRAAPRSLGPWMSGG